MGAVRLRKKVSGRNGLVITRPTRTPAGKKERYLPISGERLEHGDLARKTKTTPLGVKKGAKAEQNTQIKRPSASVAQYWRSILKYSSSASTSGSSRLL